jgi:outer membrane receptor protein involved in Fe transport
VTIFLPVSASPFDSHARQLLTAAVASACLAWSGAAAAQATPAAPVVKPAAAAQAKPKPAEEEPAAPVPESAVVTVAAERPTNRIDRQVYDLKADVGNTNNSAADALNNVPSVTVDADGAVSLRGNSNVQIMIDGKPSAMLQGDNRGAALNALPSQDIESIEVINNPGAQFGNEGGGGPILNLVMRRSRTPGGVGVVNANAGPSGRVNTSVSGSYHEGLFGFQGGINFRRDGRNSEGEVVRERIEPASGVASHSRVSSAALGLNNSVGLNGGVTWNWTDKTAFGAQFNYARRSNDQRSNDVYRYDSSDAQPRPDYLRTTSRVGDSVNASWGARIEHKGSVAGETFKADLRVSSSDNDSDNAFRNLYAPALAAQYDRSSRQHNDSGNRVVDFTGDYELPVDQGIVKLGYKAAQISNSFDTSYVDLHPLTGAETLNAGRSNRFEVDESNLALYGSYQRRLDERWGVLGGMRIEHTDLDVHQLTAAIEANNSYTNYIPSMFVSYKGDDGNVRLSYANRIRRPNGSDLNPFVVYRDEFNVSAGNPKLQPTQSDSLELGYETKIGVVETSVRAYVRKESDVISERSYFISDTVLLTTRDNAGSSRAGGLEFSLSGKLAPWIQLNTSGNYARTEQRNVNNGLAITRDSASLSLRGRVNLTVTPKDQIQFMVNTQGKTLTGQGYREPQTTANLNMRHTFSPQLSLVMNVTDLFNSNKMATTIDTPYLKETNVRRFDGRVFYLGLSYRFGGISNGNAAGRQPGTRMPQNRSGPPPGGERKGD